MRCSVVLLCVAAARAFTLNAPAARRVAPLEMGMFDGLSKAFENDPAFAQKKAAGLSGGKQPLELTVVGKKVKALPGQKMKDVIRAARAPIKFNCENGECGTCECLVNGRKTRVCQYTVPNKGPVVVTLK
mmetsp:Transcript_27589/g.84663  ORF Transcript_27589/g.84663 Transcript_27589/m.84663 type:complete len:130 (+) Transcript_27589:55-444(+)